jgi:hypothetical protein
MTGKFLVTQEKAKFNTSVWSYIKDLNLSLSLSSFLAARGLPNSPLLLKYQWTPLLLSGCLLQSSSHPPVDRYVHFFFRQVYTEAVIAYRLNGSLPVCQTPLMYLSYRHRLAIVSEVVSCVRAALETEIPVFRIAILYNLVHGYRRSVGTCCLCCM